MSAAGQLRWAKAINELAVLTMELENLARTMRCSSYYLAYAFDTDARDVEAAFVRDRSNRPYLIWQQARWAETSRRTGVKPNDPALSTRVADHLQTLASLPKVKAELLRRVPR